MNASVAQMGKKTALAARRVNALTGMVVFAEPGWRGANVDKP